MKNNIPLVDDDHCFVCGKENLQGLRIEWTTEALTTHGEFYASKTHQGWQGMVHGGILAAILDESMTRLAWETYGGAVTAEMTVRYISPARIGEKLLIKGEVDNMKGRLIPTRAEIRNTQGHIVASATGKALKK